LACDVSDEGLDLMRRRLRPRHVRDIADPITSEAVFDADSKIAGPFLLKWPRKIVHKIVVERTPIGSSSPPGQKCKLRAVEKIPEQLVQLWIKYEQIAMHFNDLLIKLRTQALGGVATIVTAAGFLASRQTAATSAAEEWEAVAMVSVLLWFGWITVWLIDVCYYSRLLRGAVVALLDLEKKTKGAIDFSHTVEKVVRKTKQVSLEDLQRGSGWQVKLFYVPVGTFLTLVACWSVWKWYWAPLPMVTK
jgi:hypothetical protein